MFSLSSVLEVLISGAVVGSIYTLLAVGLSLIFGISGVFNYAHGILLALGAYISFSLGQFIPHTWLIGILIIPIMFIIGVVIERLVAKPLRRRKEWILPTAVATLGLGVALSNVILYIWGPYMKILPPLIGGQVNFFGIMNVSWNRIAIFIITVAVVISLELFLNRTHLGLSMRAVAQDEVGAKTLGISVDKVFTFTFALGISLVGLSGFELGTNYFLTPLTGWDYFIKAFIIVVLGGVGSIKGAFYAAVLLAIVEQFVGYTIGMVWAMPVWLLILIIILVVKPTGIVEV